MADVTVDVMRPCKFIQISPDSARVAVGDTVRLYGVPRDAAGRRLGYKSVQWVAETRELISVSGSGLITSLAPGVASIRAMCVGEDLSSTKGAVISIVVPPTARFEIYGIGRPLTDGDSAEYTLPPGQLLSAILDASTSSSPAGTKPTIEWRSNGSRISGDEVTALSLKPGLYRIGLIAADMRGIADTGQALLLVTSDPSLSPVDSIRIEADRDTLTGGAVTPLRGHLVDSDGRVITGRSVVWRVASSSTAVLSPTVGESVTLRTPYQANAASVTISALSEGREAFRTFFVKGSPAAAFSASFAGGGGVSVQARDTVRFFTPSSLSVSTVLTASTASITAINGDAQWTIDGVAAWRGSAMQTFLSVGPHTVSISGISAGGGLFEARATIIVVQVASVPPQITSLTGSLVASTSAQTVHVQGFGFQSGLTATLDFPGGNIAVATGTQIRNLTPVGFDLSAVFDVAGAWSIRVSNPGDVRSNFLSFSVNGTPDLAVLDGTVTPSMVARGGSVTAGWRIVNRGTGPANSSTTAVLVNQNATNGVGGNRFFISTPSLPSSWNLVQSAVLTAATTSGTYYVWLNVDYTLSAGQSSSATANDVVRIGSFTIP